MRQDFKEPVKWFDDDDEEALGDYEELDTIADVDATQKRLAGKKKYIELTLAEIDKHAKTVSFVLCYFVSLFVCLFFLSFYCYCNRSYSTVTHREPVLQNGSQRSDFVSVVGSST